MRGRIASFIHHKGYGFIRPDDESDSDVFVHLTKLPTKSLCPSERPSPST